MLGRELADPGGIEQHGCRPGLGLLPINTTMQATKMTRLSAGNIHGKFLFGRPLADDSVAGYEIHVGKTQYLDRSEPFAKLTGGELDGCISADRHVLGTYLHGIFDHDSFRHQFLTAVRSFYNLAPPPALNRWSDQRKESLDRLAREVSMSLDMHRIFDWVGLKYQ
jgi:adenosylcobyric acid synthase